jgi:hypothetical protein
MVSVYFSRIPTAFYREFQQRFITNFGGVLSRIPTVLQVELFANSDGISDAHHL